MKIALIANNLRAGGGNVIFMNLLPEFIDILRNSRHEILVVCPTKTIPFGNCRNVKILYSKGGNSSAFRFLWQKCVMEPKIRSFNPDWTFVMGGNYAIRNLSGKQTLLFHNLNLCLNYANEKFRLYNYINLLKRFQFKSSLKFANRIYFQTSLVKDLFFKSFPSVKSEIYVMPFFVPSEVKKESTEKFRNKDNYFNLIYPAGSALHKNQQIIVSTFLKYRSELSNIRCYLTLDPIKDKLGKLLFGMVNDNKLKNIIFTGSLSRSELSNYYRSCDALIMPSKLETLGLPYIEAMYFGLPIITTDAAFSRAVCGNVALYCNSSSEENVRDLILQLKNSPEMGNEMIKRGYDFLEKKTKNVSTIVRELLDLEGIDYIN